MAGWEDFIGKTVDRVVTQEMGHRDQDMGYGVANIGFTDGSHVMVLTGDPNCREGFYATLEVTDVENEKKKIQDSFEEGDNEPWNIVALDKAHIYAEEKEIERARKTLIKKLEEDGQDASEERINREAQFHAVKGPDLEV